MAAGGSDFVLGIDFGGTKVALATATTAGVPVHSARLATNAVEGATQVLDRSFACAQELIAATEGDCIAVGAVSPGIVRTEGVLLAPNVPGWGALALPAALREGLGVDRIALGNDVKAAALAEARWGSLAGADPGVLLQLGTGVAAGIVVGGDVLDGAHGAAGEIGYNLRGSDDGAGAADGRAPLEEAVGGRAIGERGSRLLEGSVSAAEVFASRDGRAQALVDEALAELAAHVANLAIAIDPERIAVGGGLMSQPERVLGALHPRLRRAVPFPPELVPAAFVHDGGLRGAIALALGAIEPVGAEEAVG